MTPILVVEDEVDGQEIIARLLSLGGMEAQVVDSAEEAWNFVKSQPFTAVVIDLGLPGMDGLSFLRMLRADPETLNLPCMVVTAYNSSIVKKQAVEAGCNAYLVKPLEHHYFMQTISRLIIEANQ